MQCFLKVCISVNWTNNTMYRCSSKNLLEYLRTFLIHHNNHRLVIIAIHLTTPSYHQSREQTCLFIQNIFNVVCSCAFFFLWWKWFLLQLLEILSVLVHHLLLKDYLLLYLPSAHIVLNIYITFSQSFSESLFLSPNKELETSGPY